MAHPSKLDAADLARQSIILDALLHEIRYQPIITTACYRWEKRLRMRDHEWWFVNCPPHPSTAERSYSSALRQAAVEWCTPVVLRDVIKTLKRMGFPEEAAATLLAPRVLYVYLAWSRCHVPPEQPWPDPPAGPPVPPFTKPNDPIRGARRRGPRKDTSYLEQWAHWFYRVDVSGESRTDVIRWFSGASLETHEHTEDCGCSRNVRRALEATRRLLGCPRVPPARRRRFDNLLVNAPIYVEF